MMDLMFLVMMIFFIVGLSALSSRNLDKKMEELRKKSLCPPHKWERMEQPGSDGSYLQCLKCKKFPGLSQGEEL